MTLDFQKDLLRWILSSRESKNLLKDLDTDIFDLSEDKLVMDLIKKYTKEFGILPKKVTLIEFFDRQAKTINPEIYKQVLQALNSAYLPIEGDTQLPRNTVISLVQERRTRDMMKKYAGQLKEVGIFEKIRKETSQIARLTEHDQINNGLYLLKDVKKGGFEFKEAIPTKFLLMNAIQKYGGFKHPEIIVLMSSPKGLKTTMMVNLGVGFVLDGYKVLYVDTENGTERIRSMAYQNMMGLKFDELISGEHDDAVQAMVNKYKALGGELRIHELLMGQGSTDDVETELDRLWEEDGFKPDLIICDYFDNMIPSKKVLADNRFQIQGVYKDWKRVNQTRNVFTITPSQVNRAAVEKPTFSPKDVGEDFAKIGNADSVWALCMTPEEKIDGLARLIPVANRDGKDYGCIYLDVDPSRCLIEQSSFQKPTNHAPPPVKNNIQRHQRK